MLRKHRQHKKPTTVSSEKEKANIKKIKPSKDKEFKSMVGGVIRHKPVKSLYKTDWF